MKNVSHLALSVVFAVATVLVLFFGAARADTTGSAVRVPEFVPGAVMSVDAGAPYRPLVAETQDAGSGSTVVATTSGTTTTTLPSDALHNPVDDPLKALDDAKQAKKQGWAAFILALIIMVTAAFARASTKWPAAPVLSTINKHKMVIFIVACLGAGSTAVYNALTGGSWYAALLAGAVAVVAFINAAPSTPTPSASKA